MKKRIFSVFLAFLLLFALSVPAAAGEAVHIRLNGKPLEMQAKPFVQNGVTMVPLRSLAEAMGFTVEWQGNHGVRVSMENKALGIRGDLFQQGETHWLALDGKAPVKLPVPPIIRRDRTFVPLRFISQALGYQVVWEQATRTAALTDGRTLSMLEGKQADTAFSLLSGRLEIKFPAAARVGGTPGYGSDANSETNLELCENGQTMTLTAREVYAYSTGNLQTDFACLTQDAADYTLSPPVRVGEITYLPYTPKRYDEARGGLLAGALVCAADKTLLTVSLTADRFAMAFAPQCRALAEAALASLAGGQRRLHTEKQSLRLGNYTLELAPGYAYKENRGADFDVYYAYKLAAVNQSCTNFGIYIGNHPACTRGKGGRAVPDTALGKPIEWRLYAENPAQFDHNTYAEALVETGAADGGSCLHIFATPVSAADWEEIRAMVRTLRE